MAEKGQGCYIIIRGIKRKAYLASYEVLEFSDLSHDEVKLKNIIAEYYLPKQLIRAILENKDIPEDSVETIIGVGFVDIADYLYLSKFLSLKENQILLNGLFSVFTSILLKNGGYLNKIEGDSMMFHFGGFVDANVKSLEKDKLAAYISKALFYTCIAIQRVCAKFNKADRTVLEEINQNNLKSAVIDAYYIINKIRRDKEISDTINALFQIRVRVGANIGIVNFGNFGPDGHKQLDVIGIPVINAKRMEQTASVGGLRITETLYKELEKNRYYR